jgi:tRNA pseudouridine38-40 synthase
MPRYALTIAYEGTNFCGWQKQFPHADIVTPALAGRVMPESIVVTEGSADDRARVELRTVQGVVERAVREAVRETVQLQGASRTDSGVHARGQVAAFTCTDDPTLLRMGKGWPPSRGLDSLVRAVNSRLPDDVLVIRAAEVALDFDPVAAERKCYTYSLWLGRDRPLWERHRLQHLWGDLDLARMNAAAAILVGEHDFVGFATAGHGRLTTVRTVHSCEIYEVAFSGAREEPTPGRRVDIRIVGSGFLWNMVRIIAGTLVEIGRGRLSDDDVRAALATGDRTRAGPTLPARGLCLEWIRYSGDPMP